MRYFSRHPQDPILLKAVARKRECQCRPGTLPHRGADSCGIHRLNPPQ